MRLEHQKVIRTWRLSITCILLFLLTWYYQVPESAWTLITIWFVMYEYTTVGGVYTKSVLRFTGTVLSALYGMIVVYFCANNPLIDVLALVPGLFVYAYFFMGGEKTYIGTIGAVTLTIVLLNYNDIETAVVRVFNVIIGIIGSMIMIRFFYPQYARDKLLELQFNIIRQFISLLENHLNQTKPLIAVQTQYLELEQQILGSFTLYTRLLTEAKIETPKAPFFVPHSLAALQHFRRLFRLFSVFIYHISTEDLRADPWVCDQINIILFNLKNLQQKLLHHKKLKKRAVIDRVPKTTKEEVARPKQSTLIDKSRNAAEEIFTYIQQQITLLDTEISEIVLIYKVYDIKLND